MILLTMDNNNTYTATSYLNTSDDLQLKVIVTMSCDRITAANR